MKKRHIRTWILLTALLPLWAAPSMAHHSLTRLLCEQEVTPLAIGEPHPRFSWQAISETRGYEQSAWQVMVGETSADLASDRATLWDSGRRSSAQSVMVPYEGKELQSGHRYYWKVRTWDKDGQASPWSMIKSFDMGLLTDKDWSGARWIAFQQNIKAEVVTTGMERLTKDFLSKFPVGHPLAAYTMPQFRKTFTSTKVVKRAMAYVSGLGQFEFFLNGRKVGDHFLDPGWTKYDKCALYVPFDVTREIREGRNAMGIMLGNGFYNTPTARYWKLYISYGAPRLRLMLKIDYEDGTSQTVVSDRSWRATESPVTFSSIYGGEDYDATRELPGWRLPDYDDSRWQRPIDTGWTTQMLPQSSCPLMVRDTMETVRLFRSPSGKWVYDFGQNISGIVRLTIRSQSSGTVKMIPGELLSKDSLADQGASGSPSFFSYTTTGKGEEQWQPQFTYYGFRYVTLEGAVPTGKPNPSHLPEVVLLQALHTCSSSPEAGTFHCSKQMFNQLHTLIDWGIRNNMASVLTDCPHREKLGWLEMVHLMQYSLQYRYDLVRLYTKEMNDMLTSQTSEGLIPDIAPEYVTFSNGFRDSPEWGSTFIISPWYIYKWYGDRSLIEKYYPAMQRYLDYLTSKSTGHLLLFGLGDWCDIGDATPGGVTATASYYYDALLMERMARLLGHEDDANKYASLSADIKEAFNSKWWHADRGQYERNSQATNALAFFLGLAPTENRQQVYNNLVNDIRHRGNALTAGDIGFRYVVRSLEQQGDAQVIYDMNSRYDRPGYGWQLAQGATAMTESWEAFRSLSQNHYQQGHLMEWFYTGIGGLRIDEASEGFKHFIVHPEPVGDVHSAEVTHESPYGLIEISWKKTSETYSLRVVVPANSSASVWIPSSDEKAITESGLPLHQMSNLKYHAEPSGNTIIEVPAGIYTFEVTSQK